MEDYYLVGRDKDTNEFEIISLKENWYLSEKQNPIFKRRNSLAAIDLVTTKFSSASQMLKRMHENGYIKTPNMDLFIAKKQKRNNKEYIIFYEVIYNPEGKKRLEDLRQIAHSFINGDKKSPKELIDKVFNKLISKANSSQEFRNMLTCETTNVPKRLTDNFWKGSQNYSIKYQNINAFENYSTIRNIIEALNRYDYLETLPGNTFNNNIDYLNVNGSSRKKIEPKLLEVLDKEYIPGQLNLTDYVSNEKPNPEELAEQSIDKNKNESSFPEKFILPEVPNISLAKKIEDIFHTFLDLPFGFLSFKDNKPKINYSFFSSEKEISSLETEALKHLLPSSLFHNLIIYTAHKNEYQKAFLNFSNTNLLEEEIRNDEKTLYKTLKKNKDIDRIYLWTLIYKNYLAKLKENEDSSGKKAKI